jgi:hypothetical protein
MPYSQALMIPVRRRSGLIVGAVVGGDTGEVVVGDDGFAIGGGAPAATMTLTYRGADTGGGAPALTGDDFYFDGNSPANFPIEASSPSVADWLLLVLPDTEQLGTSNQTGSRIRMTGVSGEIEFYVYGTNYNTNGYSNSLDTYSYDAIPFQVDEAVTFSFI